MSLPPVKDKFFSSTEELIAAGRELRLVGYTVLGCLGDGDCVEGLSVLRPNVSENGARLLLKSPLSLTNGELGQVYQ
jgi:hypothetical protein